jgi:hypothetical protein
MNGRRLLLLFLALAVVVFQNRTAAHAAECMGSTLVDKDLAAWAWYVAPPV